MPQAASCPIHYYSVILEPIGPIFTNLPSGPQRRDGDRP